MQLVSFFCARPGLWEGSSQSTCANGRRHIMYHRAAKHTALCKSKRERGRGQQLEILSHLNICWRSNSALQWLRKKNSYHRGYDGKSCCVCTHSTQMVTWIETTWYHLGTIWTTLGHHLGQLGDHKLAPLGNYMDNTWAPLETTWRHIATIVGQHCLVTVGGAYLCQYGHVLVNAWPEPAMPPLTNLSGDPV